MKSILLVGAGNFGTLIAKQLYELDHQVMAIDKHEDRINEILPLVTNAQIGDSTNVAFLKSLGVNNYDVCIVTIGNDFQSSLETTSLLKELGAKLVVSRADREVQAKFLLRNGADGIVNPEKQVAKWLCMRYTSNNILDYISIDNEHAIFEVNVPPHWEWKTIIQIDIRKKYGVNIIGIKKNGKVNFTPLPDTVLEPDMTLLVLGEHKAVQKCFHI